jgi:hypothetical protein
MPGRGRYLERAEATRVRVAGEEPSVELVSSAVADLRVVAQEFADTAAAGTVPAA